jgi:uncharacterized membrane protein YhhN
MPNKNYVWIRVFALVAVLNLTAVLAGPDWLRWITKPFLMPMLYIWFYRETIGHQPFIRKAVLGGLIFSTAGDILLLFASGTAGELFFIGGLLAFLMAHLLYIGGFLSVAHFKNGYLSKKPYWILLFATYLGLMLWWIWPGIGANLQVPVAIYALTITTMALSAFNIRGHVESGIAGKVMTGAALFVLSDSLLAVGKFSAPFPGDGLAIILTYLAGQYLIADGAARIIISRGHHPG